MHAEPDRLEEIGADGETTQVDIRVGVREGRHIRPMLKRASHDHARFASGLLHADSMLLAGCLLCLGYHPCLLNRLALGVAQHAVIEQQLRDLARQELALAAVVVPRPDPDFVHDCLHGGDGARCLADAVDVEADLGGISGNGDDGARAEWRRVGSLVQASAHAPGALDAEVFEARSRFVEIDRQTGVVVAPAGRVGRENSPPGGLERSDQGHERPRVGPDAECGIPQHVVAPVKPHGSGRPTPFAGYARRTVRAG